ncbi:MAG: 13E12 repeat family protein [Actinomycetota bacterium]|nr:13E12 repeat family protein [Actinomycetota bacterium]
MLTVPVWQGSDAELLAELCTLETRLHSTWAQMLSVIAEIDSRGTAATTGYGTTVELVRAVARVSRGEARSRVAAAADVLSGRGLGGAPVPPRLAQTAAAVAEHSIGAADVAVIRSVLACIPPHLGDEKRAEVETELARHARTLDAGQLAVLGKRILAYLDQDGRPPKDAPETRRRRQPKPGSNRRPAAVTYLSNRVGCRPDR